MRPPLQPARAPRTTPELLNDLQHPTGLVPPAVWWRLRYKLSFRDVAEVLLQRAFEVTHEMVREWGSRFAPLEGEPRSSALRTPRAILRAARAPSRGVSEA